MEETDIRALDPAALAERPSVVTIDVSFISLKLVLPAALALAARPADIVALIKPQFEVPPAENKKGIVRNEEVHRRVCEDIASFAASLGLAGIAHCESEITGGDGNREFFLRAHLG
jgi:23S rRNA (cytidine1920-2'-O)/16S rRNA (cytidine1409-2'-O)-methyltransferase